MNNIDPLAKRRIVAGAITFFVVLLLLIGFFLSKGQKQAPEENNKESGGESAVLITDITGPYTITYLGNLDDGTYLISVTDSSPNGRQKAVQWLRDQGYDISKTSVQFNDFKNPLNKGESLE